MKKFFFLVLCLIICTNIFSQKSLTPKWVYRQTIIGEKCEFILVHSAGEPNENSARASGLADLRSQLLHSDIITVNQSIIDKSHDTYSLNDNNITLTSMQEEEGWIEIKIDGIASEIHSRRIAEFFKDRDNGLEYYALIGVPKPNSDIELSRLKETESYADDPATWGLSLIPGAAQMHKGSYLKGGLIMGGSVALAAGATLCSLTRQDYLAKMANTHSAATKQQYVTKSNNLNTGMWTCVGCLAALYVYNIVDAFVAPGARRIIVTPAVSPEGQYGASVTYNF